MVKQSDSADAVSKLSFFAKNKSVAHCTKLFRYVLRNHSSKSIRKFSRKMSS